MEAKRGDYWKVVLSNSFMSGMIALGTFIVLSFITQIKIAWGVGLILFSGMMIFRVLSLMFKEKLTGDSDSK